MCTPTNNYWGANSYSASLSGLLILQCYKQTTVQEGPLQLHNPLTTEIKADYTEAITH